jgi:hypothetical protein
VTKRKLFNLSKGKKEASTEEKMATEHIRESKNKTKIPKINEGLEEKPIKEYNETLYSKGTVQKQPTTTLPEKKQSFKRTSWESTRTIEQNVDTIGRKQTELPGTPTQTNSDIDNKVDFVLLKNKDK